MTLMPSKIEDLKRKLRDREQMLRKTIHDELVRNEDKAYTELAGRVLDAGEQAVTDVLADVRIAELQNEIVALADVVAALGRMAEGSYGVCEDCGVEIDVRRLDAYPTAKRCVSCQTRHENFAKDRTPSL